jgi:hypothetical protein
VGARVERHGSAIERDRAAVDLHARLGQVMLARIDHAHHHAGDARVQIGQPVGAALLHDARAGRLRARAQLCARREQVASIALDLALRGGRDAGERLLARRRGARCVGAEPQAQSQHGRVG